MSRRRPAPTCQWGSCLRSPVGFRLLWRGLHYFVYWFCRRHQRQWDRGVVLRRRAPTRESES